MRVTNTDKLNRVGCPKCGAKAGEPCITAKGRIYIVFKGYGLHKERKEAHWQDVSDMAEKQIEMAKNSDDPVLRRLVFGGEEAVAD